MAEVAVLLYRTDLNFEKLADINERNIEISVNVCNMRRVMIEISVNVCNMGRVMK